MTNKGVQAASAAALMALGVLASPAAYSASDIFLKLGPIKGESQDAKHKNAIDVLSWSWGLSQQANTGKLARKQPTVLCVSGIHIVKGIDRASPDLILTAAFGDRIADGELTVRRGGEVPVEFLKIKMNDIQVTSYQTGGVTGDDRPTEQVTLTFSRASVTYTPQDIKGGAGPSITAEVDATDSSCK